MRKRIAGYILWLALAGCLYFFENNTGTRSVLVCSCLLPVIPALRRLYFAPDEKRQAQAARTESVQAFLLQEDEDPGDVREYVPGDPVNRIHWKLSAKRDTLLIREQAAGTAAAESRREARTAAAAAKGRPGKQKLLLLLSGILLLAVLLLILIPEAGSGTRALLNRLFAASEKVNAYVYERLPEAEAQNVLPAALLLAAAGSALLALTAVSGSRAAALALMAGCAAFQVYFGLSFPDWANILLFTAFALWTAKRPLTKEGAWRIPAAAAAVTLAVMLFLPGADSATEDASEKARDWLSAAAGQSAAAVQETAEGETETRHAHTQSLTPGEGEAQPAEEYRLVTEEEEQIAIPRWIDYLRIALLILLAVLAVVLPFLPFLALNARRKKALEIRRAFAAENVSEAVCAIFRHTVDWLEATDNGAGNLPFVRWTEHLPEQLTADYRRRFARCAALFEEAAYSDHPLGEEQREETLALLEETEQRLLAGADWKQRLRLKYGKCLYV